MGLCGDCSWCRADVLEQRSLLSISTDPGGIESHCRIVGIFCENYRRQRMQMTPFMNTSSAGELLHQMLQDSCINASIKWTRCEDWAVWGRCSPPKGTARGEETQPCWLRGQMLQKLPLKAPSAHGTCDPQQPLDLTLFSCICSSQIIL